MLEAGGWKQNRFFPASNFQHPTSKTPADARAIRLSPGASRAKRIEKPSHAASEKMRRLRFLKPLQRGGVGATRQRSPLRQSGGNPNRATVRTKARPKPPASRNEPMAATVGSTLPQGTMNDDRQGAKKRGRGLTASRSSGTLSAAS